MKIISREEQDAQQRATVLGAVKGFVGGAAVALPMSMLLQRRWQYYRHLPLSLKAFGVIMIVVPSFVISAEHAGQRFEREHWHDLGKQELDAKAAREEQRWERLSVGDKVKDFASRHQYGIILGGWALSMGLSFGLIARNRYQSLPQKIVQARLWAQGLTLGVLIVAGVATQAQRASADQGPVRHLEADHSWRDIVEHELQEQKQAGVVAKQ
ncbi:respiratory supercomplex factor 2, mitochondrial [Phanerochaete sordida]|uniref:Respiratory supercomplex factor 2, mitochondrial n=1 Tax=Phanerochaete sordida TaxID=48140 RepID=A0A9P3L737_9APHY|nr:respiratory supercomplex factor 2, mitochondrial [Phanerochaete sordida]